MMPMNKEQEDVLRLASSITRKAIKQSIEEQERKADEAAKVLIDFMSAKGEFPAGLIKAAYYLLFGTHKFEPDTNTLVLAMTNRALSRLAKTSTNIGLFETAMFNNWYLKDTRNHALIVDIAKTILAIDPNNRQAILELTDSGTISGLVTPSDAVKLLERGVAAHPSDGVLLSNLSRAYESIMDYTKAIETLQKYIGMDPSDKFASERHLKEIKARLK